MLEELEDICTICRENLVDKGVVLDPKEPDYNFWHVCEEIREAVQDLGFTAAEGALLPTMTLDGSAHDTN